MIYAYASLMEGVPSPNGAPNLTVDIPPCSNSRASAKFPSAARISKPAKRFSRPCSPPPSRARLLGLSGWYSTNILGNRDGEVFRRSRLFQNQGGIKTRSPSSTSCSRLSVSHPRLYGTLSTRSAHQLLPAARRQQRRMGQQSTIFGWSAHPMQIKVEFLCPATQFLRAHRARSRPLSWISRSARQNCAASESRSG